MTNTIIKLFLVLSLILLGSYTYSQKAAIRIALPHSLDNNPTKYNFLITINNNGFDKYWLQDTTIIRNWIGDAGKNFIYPFVQKRVGKKYKTYDVIGPSPFPALDSCEYKCCNCILIKKGDSLNINLQLLSGYKFEKGEYRLQVAASIPILSCQNCEQLPELFSNYIYFKKQ